MKEIDIVEQQAQLVALATELFNYLVNLPKEIRPDDKERTGIQIFLREVGTRNSVFTSIYNPSKDAQSFAVEKAVRSETLNDYSSQNSENPEKMKFRGSLSVFFNDSIFQSSTSGLTGDEDTAVSFRLLRLLTGLSSYPLLEKIINCGGKIPESFYYPNHYLYKLIHE